MVEAHVGSPIPQWLWRSAAAVGGILWIVKSASILLFDKQPVFSFELAPFCFGVASLGIVQVWHGVSPKPSPVPRYLATLATLAGAVAAVAYIVQGGNGLFGPAAGVSLLSGLAVLLVTGLSIWRQHALGASSAAPWLLGWTIVVAIPSGGALEAIDERLLEVPLLAIGAGWVVLSAPRTGASRPLPGVESG
jgi:hypothetical protein